ncbi:MAG: hypothetical protein K8R18_04935 [Parvibaculum sp.]|uniref:hypothetical protein n=1 Tax=Parvibaculum sp. TaxID=2024848 RepID=UPI0025F0DDCF|nr:hypothetical protein [Parvibaculum sp.]MCE9648955.1 hypothetical protein [Parvibaculum sp.]
MKASRAIIHFLTVVAFLFTTIFPMPVATPARASTLDGVAACFKTAAGPQIAAAKLSKQLSDPHYLSCASQMSSGDVVMIGIAGALTALALGGQITSEDDCNQKINVVIGVMLAKILLGSDAVKSVLGASIVDMLESYIKGNGAALLSQIPALSVVFDEMSCGCAVAGTALAVKGIIADAYGDAKECAGLVGEVGEAFVDGLESGIDAAGNILSDATCVLSLGLFLCPDDTAEGQPNQPLPAPPPCMSAMTPKSAYVHGTCTCIAPKAKTYSADKKSVSCALCPAGQGRNDKGECAACPLGMKVADGTYGHCSIPYTCPAGTHYNDTNTGCEKDCPDGAVLQGGSCKTCAANERAEYVNTGTSAGKCVSCGDGYWSYAGDGVCYSKCASWQKWENNSCVNTCPQGTRLNTSEFGLQCEPCEKGKGSNEGATACLTCPSGSTWTALATGGGRCACPKGSKLSNGACAPCAKGATWSSDASGEHCNMPDGFPCGAGQKRDTTGACIADCGINAINDKTNPSKCVACAKGEIAFGNACVNTTISPPSPTNGNLKPNIPATLSCPEGMQVDTTGKACIKRADPAQKCKDMGANYILSDSARDGCRKCPLGKIANPGRTGCIAGVRAMPAPAGNIPPVSPPATRAPMPAPHPNTYGGSTR